MNLELKKLPFDLEHIIVDYVHQLNFAENYKRVIRQLDEMDVIMMDGKIHILSGYQRRSPSFIYFFG